VKIEVDVIGPDAHADAVFVEDADARQRMEALAHGEKGNADEAVDVRHRAWVESTVFVDEENRACMPVTTEGYYIAGQGNEMGIGRRTDVEYLSDIE
jgi:hypothetical protein